jgi:hypothetical protein
MERIPPDDLDLTESELEPLDTDVDDADLFAGLEDDDGYGDDDSDF